MIQKFSKIKEDIQSLSDRKIRLEERYKHEKEKLQSLVTQITSKGYDPTKLSELKEQKEKHLKETLESVEIKTLELSEKLKSFEINLS